MQVPTGLKYGRITRTGRNKNVSNRTSPAKFQPDFLRKHASLIFDPSYENAGSEYISQKPNLFLPAQPENLEKSWHLRSVVG
jgi:hypothetical protein